MNKIHLHLDKHCDTSYDIHIGTRIVDRIGLLIARSGIANRFAVIADSTVASLYGDQVRDAIEKTDTPVSLFQFPAGEASKTLATVISLIESLISAGMDRSCALIALGGGVTGDITGFISSIYMRSIPYIQIPTTLIAQVDSAVGGKTGVDLAVGKNLIGSFHQPKMVCIDLAFMETLPETEYTNGLAEIIKYGIIDDTDLFDTLESRSGDVTARAPAVVEAIVAQSVKIKRDVVEIDERDTGIRRILNFGHTVGHAIEAESGFTIPHGRAVASGMAVAAHLSQKLGHTAPDVVARIENLLEKFNLPRRIPMELDTNGILSRMKVDKKKHGDTLPLVLIKRIGIPFVNGTISESLIEETIKELRT